MVVKSIERSCNQSPKSSRRTTIQFSYQVVLAIIASIILSFCSTPITDISLSITPKPSQTETPQPTSTTTSSPTKPTPTSTPLNIYGTPIPRIDLAGGRSLFEPIDIPIQFEIAFEHLSPGLYIVEHSVDSDTRSEKLSYVSVDLQNQGQLVGIQELIRANKVYTGVGKTFILGGFATTRTRYLLNLSHEKAYEFHICTEGWDEPSPSGVWLASICTEPGSIQYGEVIAEIISLHDGIGYQLEIPSHGNIRYSDNFINWVSDESFIALVGTDEEPCLINLSDLSMRCAATLKDKPIRSVSRDWLIGQTSRGESWILDIYMIACFDDQTKCDPAVTLEDEALSTASLSWSPNETLLGVISGSGLTAEDTEVGYYDAQSWEYHRLVVLPPDYGLVDWCPDSSCMVVSGEFTFIVYMDGRVERLPYDIIHPIAVIEVP